MNGTAASSRSRSSSGNICHRVVAARALGGPAPDLPSAVRRLLELLELVLDGGQIHPLYGGRAMRLAKYLASAGVASRRAAEELIRSGRVSVGGVAVTDPARDVAPADSVTVDGEPVEIASERVVFAVNKPLGVVSTARDPQGRPTVVSLVPTPLRLYPVGRLDIDTTGLILLTNDGDLAHRLTHPRFEVDKSYRAVVVNPPVRDSALRALRAGVRLDDGR